MKKINAQAQQKGASLGRRVTAAGASVPAAAVTLLRSKISVHADSSGIFKIGNLPALHDILVILGSKHHNPKTRCTTSKRREC